MPALESLGIWEFPKDAVPERMGELVTELADSPDARGVLLSVRDDVVALQLTEGEIGANGRSRLHVERQGAFDLLRREEWPPTTVAGRPRVVVTARAVR